MVDESLHDARLREVRGQPEWGRADDVVLQHVVGAVAAPLASTHHGRVRIRAPRQQGRRHDLVTTQRGGLAASTSRRSRSWAVLTLLAQGADPNVTQADGATALHWAAHRDDAASGDGEDEDEDEDERSGEGSDRYGSWQSASAAGRRQARSATRAESSEDMRPHEGHDETGGLAGLVGIGPLVEIGRRQVLGPVEGELAVAAETARGRSEPFEVGGPEPSGSRRRSASSTSATSWIRGGSTPAVRNGPLIANSTTSCDSRTTSAQLSVKSTSSASPTVTGGQNLLVEAGVGLSRIAYRSGAAGCADASTGTTTREKTATSSDVRANRGVRIGPPRVIGEGIHSQSVIVALGGAIPQPLAGAGGAGCRGLAGTTSTTFPAGSLAKRMAPRRS